jgi:adenine C2-methylase RlmN of 23S rRNA A2503 and tRNA A37
MSARDCRQSPSRGEQLTKLVLLYLGDATSQRHQNINIMRRGDPAYNAKRRMPAMSSSQKQGQHVCHASLHERKIVRTECVAGARYFLQPLVTER